jgi:hypothetical protein
MGANGHIKRSLRQHQNSLQGKTPHLGKNTIQGVPIQCQFCSGQAFRRSTLRGKDFTQLLLMRYPVRCLRCSQRQEVSFTVASLSLSSKTRPQQRGPKQTAAQASPAEDRDLRKKLASEHRG